jgi:LPS O-antigen subunit length determinant protein (WzzB/FepE family)
MEEKSKLDKAFEENIFLIIFFLLKEYKKIIAGALLLGLASYLYSFLEESKYQSTIIISDAKGSKVSDLGGISSLLTGVSQVDKELSISLMQMKSSPYLMEFIKKFNLPVNIYTEDYKFPNLSKMSTLGDLSSTKKNEFNEEDLKDAALRISSNIEYKSNGAVTEVTLESGSAFFSKLILDGLISFANDQLRSKVIIESEKEIEYLKQQIALTSLTDLKNSLSGVVKDKITTISLAKSKEDFLFKIIEPASYNPTRIFPNRNLYFALGILLGAFLVILFYVRAYFKK